MSLRRFAIIAPLTYHNHNGDSNKTAPSETTKITGQQQQQQRLRNTATTHSNTTPTMMTTNPHKLTNSNTISNNHANSKNFDNNNNNNNADDDGNNYTFANANTIYNNYYGNSGLQTMRASFGVGGIIGHSSVGGGSGAHTTYPNPINGNVNLLLGGAMLSLVISIICVVCYCCHRNIRKRTEAAYRQQNQWLENDPNMEIYSVEQCYETSGLFLGESTEAFTTLATLHHEPPPSYDAVLAMQEQQLLQQQLYQQRLQQQHQELHVSHNSPPPGYRSTLDVHATPLTSSPTNTANGAHNSNSHENLSGSCNVSSCDGSINNNGNSCSNFFSFNKQTPTNANTKGGNNNNSALLNMKKVLNAQSCCSLQRAEVENMWNAAAAAVVARAAHATPSTIDNENANGAGSSTSRSRAGHTPPMLLARKSLPLPLTLPVKFASNTVGRRYLPHNSHFYRRGCPLCGKFRYDQEETLTLSVESGLDVPTSPIAVANVEQAGIDSQSSNDLRASDSVQNVELAAGDCLSASADREHLEMAIEAYDEDMDEDEDECSCSYTIANTSTVSPTETTMPTCNKNNNNNNHSSVNQHSEGNVEATTTDTDQNANEQDATTSAAAMTNATTTATTTATATAAAATGTGVPRTNTLDAINANAGIIRVDMSKIIDQTGLPTYDAALKLESSGYV